MKAKSYLTGLLLLLQLFVISGLLAQSDTCDSRSDYVGIAQESSNQGDFETATQMYGCVLKFEAGNVEVRLARIASAILAEDYMSAYSDVFWLNNTTPETVLAHLDKLRQMEAEQYQTRAFLAIFVVVPDYDLALVDAEQILTAEPDNAFAYVIQATAYEGLEDFEAASVAFNQAVERSPENAQIYGLMAAAQFTTFNIPDMRENASRALELDPGIPQLYRLRGFTSMVMGDPEAAIEDANQAIELEPDYFAYYVLRGNAYRATGNLEAALADFNQIIALVPQSSFGYALRAEVQMQLGQEREAAADLAMAIELDTLERIDGESLVIGHPEILNMVYGRAYYLPFDAEQDTVLTISVTSVEQGEVDPLILVLDPDGTPLIFNDDADADPANGVLDAVIAGYEVPTAGIFTLVVGHALGGSEGDIEVLIEQN